MLRSLTRRLAHRQLGAQFARPFYAAAISTPVRRPRRSEPLFPPLQPAKLMLHTAQRTKSSAASSDCDDLDGSPLSGIDPMESLEEDIDLLQSPADDELNSVDDALLNELFRFTTAEQIFSFIDGNIEELTKQQAIRCVLVLWEYYKSNGQRAQRPVPANATATTTTTTLPTDAKSRLTLDITSESCARLLQRIGHLTADLNPDELTICLLYLSKLGWDNHHPVMQQLLDACLERLKDDQIYFPLTALSRFAVAVNSFKDIYTFFMCQDAFARMLHHLDTLNGCEDLRLLTIGLNSLHQLISNNTLDAYTARVQQLLDCGVLTAERVKCLLKVIQFLNYPHWSQRNTRLLRELVLLLRDRIETFQVNELEQVFRVFQSQLEPAELTTALTRHAQTLFERTPTAELLACSVMYALPGKRAKLTEFAKEFIYSKEVSQTAPLSTLFKILRYLKISNVHICDGYWSKVMNEIRTNESEQQSFVLARHCHRYMHFNNNLGGTYHHKEFEKYVIGLMVEEMRTGITAYIPAKFAKVAAFIIAYGHTPNSRQILPEFIVCRIEDMSKQFKILDCLHISRGIQIALQMRFKKFISPELADQLRRIELVLNQCSERHLAQPDLTMGHLNSILRAYNNRQTSTKTPLFHKIMQKYTEIPNKLNSRAIREITFNLNASKYLMPSVCASLVQYIIDNRDYVMGDTVEKVLYCCYNLGYIPAGDEVMDAALHIINRDFDYMSGLSIVQACLAMNFYRALPETLINRVFNIDFIKRVEDEIDMCYSKATYPERVLNQVMQLNRAVCLDCPASGVPWFQQNYIEAQMSKLPIIKSKFQEDIKSMLVAYLKDSQLLKVNHVTPYGYHIDFVLHFDKNRKPVPPPRDEPTPRAIATQSAALTTTNPDSLNKVAILLMRLDAFCQNNSNQLRGPEILRERHLEMLGYKVVQVNHNEWNSLYMSVPGAKLNYLKGLLEIE